MICMFYTDEVPDISPLRVDTKSLQLPEDVLKLTSQVELIVEMMSDKHGNFDFSNRCCKLVQPLALRPNYLSCYYFRLKKRIFSSKKE